MSDEKKCRIPRWYFCSQEQPGFPVRGIDSVPWNFVASRSMPRWISICTRCMRTWYRENKPSCSCAIQPELLVSFYFFFFFFEAAGGGGWKTNMIVWNLCDVYVNLFPHKHRWKSRTRKWKYILYSTKIVMFHISNFDISKLHVFKLQEVSL